MEREPRWDYAAPCPFTSWKPPGRTKSIPQIPHLYSVSFNHYVIVLHWVAKVQRLLSWQKSPCECPTTFPQLSAPEQLLSRNMSHKQQDHLFWRLETEILFLGNIQWFKAHSYVFHKMSFSSFSSPFEPIHIFQWEQGWWTWVPVPISEVIPHTDLGKIVLFYGSSNETWFT